MSEEKTTKKEKKRPLLKQYMVFGAELGKDKADVTEFLLETCPLNARKTFQKMHPSVMIWQVMQTAVTDSPDYPEYYKKKMKKFI